MSTAVENAPAQFAPTASQLEMAYSVCRSIARSAAKNFYYGFLVLPQRKRNALSAVYAFMRRCDDITDDITLSPGDRHNQLLEWLDKVHRAFAAQPTDDPVLLALTDAQRAYQIPIGLLDQLAYGTAVDLDYSAPEPSAAAPPAARGREPPAKRQGRRGGHGKGPLRRRAAAQRDSPGRAKVRFGAEPGA